MRTAPVCGGLLLGSQTKYAALQTTLMSYEAGNHFRLHSSLLASQFITFKILSYVVANEAIKFFYFIEKIRLDISIRKCDALFSLKFNTYFKMSVAVVIGFLKVNIVIWSLSTPLFT